MYRRVVLKIRVIAMLLMAVALAAALAACSGSDAPMAGPESGLEPTQFADATESAPPNATEDNLGETVLPTPAFVRVSSVGAPVTETRGERQTSGGAQIATPPAGGNPSDADVITPEQMVAAFEDVLHGIYENILPSVVYIRVASPASEALRGIPGIPEDMLWGAGSGFVWDEEGHIVTNHHVVDAVIGNSNEVTVIFADSTEAKATVVGGDPHSDLAVVKLEEGDWELQPAPLGDSSEVRVGQLSVAIGAPFGQEFTMTSGIVSAVGRNIRGGGQFTIPEVIQTDSAINPGNSGGPLLDLLGQVIGINTQIISRTGSFSGVGMAVPVNIAHRVVPPLIADGKFNYPWLGVTIATVGPAYADSLGLPEDTRGALISAIAEDSPADKAGLRGSESTVTVNGVDYAAGGDIIIAIGPHEVSGFSDLIAHLTYHNSPGDTVILTVLRDGERQEIEVTLGERPDPVQ